MALTAGGGRRALPIIPFQSPPVEEVAMVKIFTKLFGFKGGFLTLYLLFLIFSRLEFISKANFMNLSLGMEQFPGKSTNGGSGK